MSKAFIDDYAKRCFDTEAGKQMDKLLIDLGTLYRERNDALQQLADAHHQALLRLALVEDGGHDEGLHRLRTAFIAEALALALGHGRAWAAMLRKAAPLHELGIPGMLRKSRLPLFELAAEISRARRERFDGRGFPGHLAGESIPVGARIVAVARFFDACVIDHGDDSAAGQLGIRLRLDSERGCAFDPRVVDALLARWPRFVAMHARLHVLALSFEDLGEGIPLDAASLEDAA